MIDDTDPPAERTSQPAERRSQSALGEAFGALGRERMAAKRAARRARRRRTLVRASLTAAGCLVLGGSLAVGVGGLTGNGPLDGDSGAPGRNSPKKLADGLTAGSTVADPRGGPPWGLSTYTSQKDEQCVIAARVVNGQLGVITNGAFQPLRRGALGFCDRLSRSHLIFTVGAYSATNGGRTVLYGQADREVQRLVLQRGRHSRNVRLLPDGTFLVVTPGVHALRGWRFIATLRSGQRSYQLG